VATHTELEAERLERLAVAARAAWLDGREWKAWLEEVRDV